MHDHFQRVETERLILREVTVDDARDLYEVCGDPEVTKYLAYPTHGSVEDTLGIIDHWYRRVITNHIPIPNAIVLKESGKVIGTIDYVRLIGSDSAEIGYQLGRMYWDNGYMTEALNALIEESFTYMGMRRLQICHLVTNIRSEKVINKAGFIYEGTARKYAFDKEIHEFVDVKFYGLLREERKREE